MENKNSFDVDLERFFPLNRSPFFSCHTMAKRPGRAEPINYIWRVASAGGAGARAERASSLRLGSAQNLVPLETALPRLTLTWTIAGVPRGSPAVRVAASCWSRFPAPVDGHLPAN